MKLKRLFATALLLGGLSGASAQAQTNVWNPDNGNGTFTNPLLWGDWPDPDVIRVGEDYYMVASSFTYLPLSLIHI